MDFIPSDSVLFHFLPVLLGDPTPLEEGRLTLNLLRHISIIGTIIVPTILLISPLRIPFGYARPMPFDVSRFRHPKRDMFWVALAGPAANLAMLLFWATVMKLLWVLPVTPLSPYLYEMSKAGLRANLVLMGLNLVPLPHPLLDGGGIVVSLLPPKMVEGFARVEHFVLRWPLLQILLLGILLWLLLPVLQWLWEFIPIVFQMPNA